MLDDVYGRKYKALRVKRQFIHPDYEKTYDPGYKNLEPIGDIGIVELEKPVEGWPTMKLPPRTFISCVDYC